MQLFRISYQFGTTHPVSSRKYWFLQGNFFLYARESSICYVLDNTAYRTAHTKSPGMTT